MDVAIILTAMRTKGEEMRKIAVFLMAALFSVCCSSVLAGCGDTKNGNKDGIRV